MAANVIYARETALSVDEFIDVMDRSTLGRRRPLHDRERMKLMVDNSTLVVSARIDGRIVGVARSLCDFAYCCYLADLAVDEAHQKQGIGKGLLDALKREAGEKCAIILLAAPAARTYYPHIGMEQHPSCWIANPQW